MHYIIYIYIYTYIDIQHEIYTYTLVYYICINIYIYTQTCTNMQSNRTVLIQVLSVCVSQSCRLVRHGRNYKLELYWTRNVIGVRQKNGPQVWSMSFKNLKVGVLVANEVVPWSMI